MSEPRCPECGNENLTRYMGLNDDWLNSCNSCRHSWTSPRSDAHECNPCEKCDGTGWYGDNEPGWYGDNWPGIKGNAEYVACGCEGRDMMREMHPDPAMDGGGITVPFDPEQEGGERCPMRVSISGPFSWEQASGRSCPADQEHVIGTGCHGMIVEFENGDRETVGVMNLRGGYCDCCSDDSEKIVRYWVFSMKQEDPADDPR